MAPQGGGAAPPYWTEWEWHDERQMLRRELVDYRGRVLRTQFGARPQNQNQNPRYPPAQNTLPQQQDVGEQEPTTRNYEFRSASSTGAFQEGVSQQEEMTFPDPHRDQSVYVSPPPNQPSSFQNPTGFYSAPANPYGSQPRYGFPAAQNAQSGYGGSYRASNPQPAAFGLQDQYRGPYSQYEGQGSPIQLSRFNPQLSPGETMDSGYLNPAASFQQRSSWSTEGNGQYGIHTEQRGSPGFQQHQSAITEQSDPAGFPEPYSILPGNVAPSGHQVNPTLPSQGSFTETPSGSAQDESPNDPAAIPSNRRQVMYRDPHRARFDSITVDSESGRQNPYDDDPDSDATVEVASSKLTNQQRSQDSKIYRPKDRTKEGKEASRSRSRPPLTGLERASSYNADSIAQATDNMRHISLNRSNKRLSVVDQTRYPPTSLHQESEEPRESSTRIPPQGFDRPEYDEEPPALGDMTKTPHSRRRDSDARRQSQRPGFFQRHDSKNPKDQPAKPKERVSGNKDPKRKSDSLDEEFRVHPSKDFKKGRVLMTLWSEPYGNASGLTYEGEMGGSTEPAKYGQNAYNSVRRFVIVKENKGSSLCVPILTYGGRATTKPGVKPDDHAIIHTTSTAPQELPNEQKLRKKPVRVNNFSEKDKLAPESRVNYSKLYTIEHNFRVSFIGKIHEDSKAIFFTQVKKIFEGSDEEEEEKKTKKDRKRA